MKKSAIKDIFHGFRGHMDTMGVPKNSTENLGIVSNTYDQLKEKLSPEILSSHQKFVDALENNWSEEVDFYFVEGFKLGLVIGVECMEE